MDEEEEEKEEEEETWLREGYMGHGGLAVMIGCLAGCLAVVMESLC